ncbi:serpin family protein [Bifidobacterium simiarum]|nr:serpin family protein [Bifidobacterium simiarum]
MRHDAFDADTDDIDDDERLDDWDDDGDEPDWDDDWDDEEFEEEPLAPEAPKNVVSAIRDFAVDSTSEFLSADGNVNYSPTSLWMALMVALTGAGGRTKAELEKALHAADITASDLADFRREMNAMKAYDIADSVWVWKGCSIRESWRATVHAMEADVFDAEPFDAGTGRRMSQWVSDHTRGMLSPNISVNPSQMLVLINALVAEGTWKDKFNKSRTRTEIFHGTNGDVPVPMMRQQSGSFGYARGDGWVKVTIPFVRYRGGLTCILPDDRSALDRLVGDTEELRKAFNAKASSWGYLVDLSIPRFTVQSTFDSASLCDHLAALGIVSAFDAENADFSGMADLPLFIGEAIQETRMEVSEEGAKAAAYTMFAMALGGPPPEPKKVRVRLDRPFIYALDADLSSDFDGNAPLFVGILRDPAEGAE